MAAPEGVQPPFVIAIKHHREQPLSPGERHPQRRTGAAVRYLNREQVVKYVAPSIYSSSSSEHFH